MTDNIPKRDAISNEIVMALSSNGILSSADLIPLCGSAMDTTDVSRCLYDMRKTGVVEIADERVIGGKGKPVKFYRLTAISDSEDATSDNPHITIDVTPEDAAQHAAPAPTEPTFDSADATELALASLLDHADEALLTLADSLLSGNNVWSAMRKLADDAHGALCDYRLMRSIESRP